MSKEQIEKLKNNEKPFGLLTPEEQECFRKVSKGNCLYVSDMMKKWYQAPLAGEFCYGCTYRIKPDYQPEPEFVDLEIILLKKRGKLGCSIDNYWHDLHELPSLPNFVGFKRDYDKGCFLYLSNVARVVSENKKVFARFRK